MGFDAGSITGHMNLNTDQAKEDLEDFKADLDEFTDEEHTATLEIDNEPAKDALDDVAEHYEEVKEGIDEDSIDPKVDTEPAKLEMDDLLAHALEVGTGIRAALSGEGLEGAGGGGGGSIATSIDRQLFGNMSSPSGIFGWIKAGFLGLGPAILPGLGTALAGMVAGTTIGIGGLLAAAIPGAESLDIIEGLRKAENALQEAREFVGPGSKWWKQQYNQEIAAGESPAKALIAASAKWEEAQLAFREATRGVSAAEMGEVDSVLKGVHAAGAELKAFSLAHVLPSVLKFAVSMTGDWPKFFGFIRAASGAFGQFMDRVDSALKSRGFATFVKTMTSDVGPIMHEFGIWAGHAATTFGYFLELFGGAPADAVGKWFDRTSGRLANFLGQLLGVNESGGASGVSDMLSVAGSRFAGVTSSEQTQGTGQETIGWVNSMQSMFNKLGDVLGHVLKAFDHLWDALKPVAGLILDIVGAGLILASDIIDWIPKWLITAVVEAALAFTAWNQAVGLFRVAWALFSDSFDASVVGIIIVALILLVTHWHEVVHYLKVGFDWLNQNVFQPMWHWFDDVIVRSFEKFENAAAATITRIRTDFENWWNDLYSKVLHPIIDFFTKTIPNAWSALAGIFKTAFSAIATAVSWVWNNVLWPVLKPFWDVFQGIEKFGSWIVHLFTGGGSNPKHNVAGKAGAGGPLSLNLTVNVDKSGNATAKSPDGSIRVALRNGSKG